MTAEIEIQRGKVYEVERGRSSKSPVGGMVRGLGIVLNHFVKSYGAKNSKKSDIAGTFTVQYPEERTTLPEAYRNMPVLLYDDESGHELCTSCFQCERICPPQVIHITQAKDPATGKAVPAVEDFVIEYDACMSCGLCAEVCPFDAIKMDHEFELSTANHPGLTVHREALDRPVSYYARLAPTAWDAAKAGAYKKLQGSMKRRSGLLGIAPQMRDKVPTDKVQVTAAAPAANVASAAPVARPAPAAAPPPAPAASAPSAPAASGPSTPDEKKARLEAIRAANAAQRPTADPGQTSGPASAPTAVTPAEPSVASAPAAGTSVADEKKARLEAIRAAKAAQKAGADAGQTPGQAPAPATLPAQPPVAEAASAPVAAPPAEPLAAPAAGASMPDEKKARLEAIRAAKAAQKAAEQADPTKE